MKRIVITAVAFFLATTCAFAHHGRRAYAPQPVCSNVTVEQAAVAPQSTFADGAKIGPETAYRAYQPHTSAYVSYGASHNPCRTSRGSDYGIGWGWGNGWNGQGYRWHSGW